MSEDSLTSAIFQTGEPFELFADLTVTGSADAVGGLSVLWRGQTSRLELDTATGEIGVQGGFLPSYSFSLGGALTYARGETVRLGLRYRPRSLAGDRPASVEYIGIRDGTVHSSGALAIEGEFEMDTAFAELPDDFQMGGHFRLRPTAAAGLGARVAFENIRSLGGAGAPQRTYSIAKDDDQLRVVDLSTGATLGATTLTLPGATITGCTALAEDPLTGTLYGILKLEGQMGRELATIDPASGACTSVGDTGDNFAAIAFDSTGILFGLTGDGATVHDTIFTLSRVDATSTLFLELGDGDDGEALGFSPDDGFLYHASGVSDKVFQVIDTDTLGVTDIPLSGDNYGEGRVLAYEGSSTFLVTSNDPVGLYRVTTAGVVTFAAALDHSAKGLAPIFPASCDSDPQCDDGLFCTGVETCDAGFCRFGDDPCPGQFCNEQTETCGCLTDPDCDDEDPCTADSCDTDTGDCFNDPVPDTDGDGWCDTVDNCPQFSNPDQGPALFGLTVLALDEEEWGWASAVNMVAVRGIFVVPADIGSYETNAQVSGFSDRLFDPTMPGEGTGLWYLLKPDCPVGSWSSGGPGELPGVRDAGLP